MEEVKKKIIITGSSGLLGEALNKKLFREYKVIGLSRRDCDIAEEEKITKVIIQREPDLVIHCAAITNVDRCELEPEYAYKVNTRGTEYIAKAVKKINATLLFISTDHIFDGTKTTPYREEDKPNPINVYGKTKLEAENIVKDLLKKYIIIRTSWLFGRKGRGFVETILEHAQKAKFLKIAADKFATPTYSIDLADAILRIIDKLSTNLYGVYHITNDGSCNWFTYALRILEFSGIKNIELIPIKFEELNLPAKRPIYSVLDKSRFYNLTGYNLRPWQDALREYLNVHRFKE